MPAKNDFGKMATAEEKSIPFFRFDCGKRLETKGPADPLDHESACKKE
jgi:hypothetical protein